VPTNENLLANLPDDKESLKALLWQERDSQRQRADELYLETLRLKMELERYKKTTYGPRADRLSVNQLAQVLLEFAEGLEQKPINLEDLRPRSGARGAAGEAAQRAACPGELRKSPGQHTGL
jgi:hypothetical protein